MIVALFLAALLLPSGALAQTVLINEIAWMGSPVDGVDPGQEWRYEWLELYNPGSAGSLNGWSLELWRDELEFRIPLSGLIPAQEYFLVASSDRIPDGDLNYANLGGKFFNGGMRVVLKNAQGTIVEDMDARDGWFAGDNDAKQSMERRFGDLPASDPATWGTARKVGGTPKAENTVSGISLEEERKTKDPASAESFSGFKPSSVVTDSPFPLALGFGLLSAVAVLWIRSRLPWQA